jgi:hypothetical protein
MDNQRSAIEYCAMYGLAVARPFRINRLIRESKALAHAHLGIRSNKRYRGANRQGAFNDRYFLSNVVPGLHFCCRGFISRNGQL